MNHKDLDPSNTRDPHLPYLLAARHTQNQPLRVPRSQRLRQKIVEEPTSLASHTRLHRIPANFATSSFHPEMPYSHTSIKWDIFSHTRARLPVLSLTAKLPQKTLAQE